MLKGNHSSMFPKKSCQFAYNKRNDGLLPEETWHLRKEKKILKSCRIVSWLLIKSTDNKTGESSSNSGFPSCDPFRSNNLLERHESVLVGRIVG